MLPTFSSCLNIKNIVKFLTLAVSYRLALYGGLPSLLVVLLFDVDARVFVYIEARWE